MCFEKIKEQFSCILFNCVYLFLYSYCLPYVATLQHHLCLPWATVPLLSPFVMWKQPFSCSDSLSFHPDAWHSWQIGCGSEGDGLWKQCSCPLPLHTHSAHTREHGQTKIQKHHCARACVCFTHITYSHSTLLGDKEQRLCCKQGDDPPECVSDKKETGNGNADFLQL